MKRPPNKVCGKVQYETYTNAKQVADTMLRRDKRQGRTTRSQEVYRCPNCATWHLTSHSYTTRNPAKEMSN